MAGQNNTAYDFSLFEPKEETAPVKEPPKPKKKRQIAAIRPATLVKWAASAMVVVLLLSAILLSNVQLTRLNDKISAAQQQLTAANAEEVRLNMQLEGRSSLNNVENYAVGKLGLQKMGQYQLHYIRLMDKDKVQISPKGDSILERLMNQILAYL